MYNATIKFIAPFLLTASLILPSCGKSPERVAAESLLSEADSSFAQNDYSRTILLLDSLQAAFPNEIEVQRNALSLRPKAVEKITIAELTETDSLLAVYAAQNEILSPAMKTISGPELVESYKVPLSGYDSNFLNSTGLQPRVDEIGQFYMISSVAGSAIRHNSITIRANGGEVSTSTVPFDGDSNYRIGTTEMVTYLPNQCDTVGQFISTLPESTPAILIFNGENGKKITKKLTPQQVKGIADAYRFSKSIVWSRDLTVRKEKLEKKLQIARDQIARTSDK